MCGIAGIISLNKNKSDHMLAQQGESMARAILHRGPDSGGTWTDQSAGIVLAHRRLAVIDLSPGGCQPMVSASDRYVMTYNGEIFNFPDLRRELGALGVSFKTSSDTEILLSSVEQWGVRGALERANGQFAIALWDRRDHQLWLARDRLGQKPLYFGWAGSNFAFGSELKSIAVVEGFTPQIDRNIASLYMRHGYVPEPHCIWRGIQKLTPGTLVCVDTTSLKRDVLPTHDPYWQARDVAVAGKQSLLPDSSETLDGLDNVLRDAVRSCMIADVPLGAFLSGGIDSSTVVALMQAESERRVRTFSIGFHEDKYNEATHAAEVARHLGTDHTELYLTQRDAMDVIPSLPALYDEPFADSSQIPTYLVSRMAREHVTVALSGDGGDELFGGYNRYTWGNNIALGMKVLPGPLRRVACGVVRSLPVGLWDALLGHMPRRFQYQHPGDKIHKLAAIMDAKNAEQAYWRLTSLWQNPDQLVLQGAEPETALGNPARWPELDNLSEQMMALDAETYLPGDILVKVDRASMSVALEARVPLLDHRVVEFAWRLPLSMKIRGGTGKWALRQVLYRYIPKELIERPKMGFGVPIDSWLRGDLREWAEDLLDERRLDDGGIFTPGPIRQCWAEHLSGQRNWQHHLWAVLMFQAWVQNNEVGIT